MTQEKAILQYLKTHKNGITTMEMMSKLGIACPTKAISNLRKGGYTIIGKQRTAVSRYGRKVQFLEYILKGEKK